MRFQCVVGCAIVAATSVTHADTATFMGVGPGHWTDGANWSTNPNVPGNTAGTASTDVAIFANPGDAVVQVDAYRNVFGVTVDNASNLTLNGGTLVLTHSASLSRLTTGGSAGTGATINSHLVLAGDTTITNNNPASYLAFGASGSPTIFGSATSGTQSLNLAGDSSLATNVVASSIGDGHNGGNMALVKSAIGTWVLRGNNTNLTGGITINSVTSNTAGAFLRIESDNALGAGPLTINSSAGSASQLVRGTLQLAGNIRVPTGTVSLTAGGKTRSPNTNIDAPFIQNVSGNNVFARNIASATANVLIESVAGKLTFTGNFTNSNGGGGSTTVKPIYLYGAGDGEIFGRVQNGASRPVGVIKQGAGTWALSNPSTGATRNNYLGTTIINAGTLLINTDNSLATGHVALNATSTLGGSGIIGGATTAAVGSFLSPGASVGTLIFANNTATALDIAGLASGTGGLGFELATVSASDAVVLSGASGTLSIGTGALDLNDFNFTALSGFGAGIYLLFGTNQPISGSLGATVAGTVNGADVALSFADGGTDLVLTVSVPEPGLAGVALVTVAACLRRQRRVPSSS